MAISLSGVGAPSSAEKLAHDIDKVRTDAESGAPDAKKKVQTDLDDFTADARDAGFDPDKFKSAMGDILGVTGVAGHGDQFAKDIGDLFSAVGFTMSPESNSKQG